MALLGLRDSILLKAILVVLFISIPLSRGWGGTAWIPMAEAPSETMFSFNTGVGYQEFIITQENPNSGLYLIQGFPYIFFLSADVHVYKDTESFIESLDFRVQALFNHDSIIPFLIELPITSRPVAGSLRFAIAPSFITGYETNAVGMKVYGSQRAGRFFYSLGMQLGSHIYPDRWEFFYSAFTGIGVEIFRETLELSIEVSTDFRYRTKLAGLLSVDVNRFNASAGISWNIAPGMNEPGFLVNVGF